MRESWRWFGPDDGVSLDHIRQTGARDIVTALHHITIGDVWPMKDILQRQELIENSTMNQTPLKWSVVESVPIHDDIKRGAGDCAYYTANFITTLENLAEAGIRIICYNFMPVLDWTRTDLSFPLASGANALRFDQNIFAAFDLFILKRPEAHLAYTSGEIEQAKDCFNRMTETDVALLTRNIISGLPGKMTEGYGLEDFRAALAKYKGVSKAQLRENLLNFLSIVLPEAERLGIKLTIHPDDPPRDLFGLPRIICTADDLNDLFEAQPSSANGLALCVGTFGSHPDNDLPHMAERFAGRIYFSHLRGVSKDAADPRSFTEAEHLDSDIDMVAVVEKLLLAEKKTGGDIFFRPDHGHQMLDDLQKNPNPGYSAIGRLKGLAEIRGVIRALQRGMGA